VQFFALNQALLVAGLLFFVAIGLSAASQRIGVPSLLVFLAVGLLATELPGAPSDLHVVPETAALIGNLALAVILLDGGLRTRLATFRMVAGPALTLATLGVVLTAAVVGAVAVALLGFDWRYGLLMGAIVGSTDAAAVFGLIGRGDYRLNERVEATLEVESGINDPMAVFLTIAMIELIRLPEASAWTLAPVFVTQLGVGLAAGWGLGKLLGVVVARIRLGEGLYALLIQSGGLLIFALTNLMQGSGFLAIYIAGMMVAHRRTHVSEDVLRVSDGFAWLAQAGMFLLLGLVTNVHELMSVVTLQAVLVAIALMVFARPLATAICLLPFRYPVNEIAFIGWMGMRGAVPIVLALFPLLAGLPRANFLFHIAFFTVLLSLLAQGGTLPLAARLSGVGRPRAGGALSSATLEGGGPPREVAQLVVAPDSPTANRVVDDIEWPTDVRLIEVSRDSRIIDAERFEVGDVVTVVTPVEAIPELEDLFGPPAESGELALAPTATFGDLHEYYGVPLPEGASAGRPLLTDFVGRQLHGRAAAGDVIDLGALGCQCDSRLPARYAASDCACSVLMARDSVKRLGPANRP
jgi:potassium/hydrogen antiporter